MIDFENQKILVIGGSSGIGFATAQLAAELGAAVTIASRSEAKLRDAAERIGPGIAYRGLDLTSDDPV
ncbi:MAG: SDR family NAD(P)-dependent oxidoreductase, partial [Gammaproteobacteria bacterium]